MPVNVVLVPDDLPLSGKLVYTEQGLSTTVCGDFYLMMIMAQEFSGANHV
jgi:hypothetical protein